jgi:PAS domain S-box-containing protein
MAENQQEIERLKRGEEVFRQMVHAVKDYGIFMLDPGGHVMTWNEGAERIKGFTARDIIGQHFSKFYPPEDLAAGKPAMELREATRVGRFEDVGWRVRKDGTRFWANVIITAVFDENGELRGFTKVTRDLTDQKLIEEERAMRLAAQAASEAKSRFLASMSHELRTPLNSVIGFTGVLLMELPGPLNGEQKRQLQQIDTSAKHLLDLINNILDLAKIEAGQADLNIENLDCKPVLEAVYNSMKLQADAKKLTLSFDAGENVVAVADERAVRQIALNLVANAIKFTEPGGEVSMEVKRTADASILFRVVDTGIGISDIDKLRLFQAFGQVHDGRRHEGTGLGLYLSQTLAEAMNGSIEVDSKVGKGSTFTVSLPAAVS